MRSQGSIDNETEDDYYYEATLPGSCESPGRSNPRKRSHVDPDASSEEESKRRRRLLANRRSAARSRAKKLGEVGDLESQVDNLSRDVDTLKAELTNWQARHQQLVSEHKRLVAKLHGEDPHCAPAQGAQELGPPQQSAALSAQELVEAEPLPVSTPPGPRQSLEEEPPRWGLAAGRRGKVHGQAAQGATEAKAGGALAKRSPRRQANPCASGGSGGGSDQAGSQLLRTPCREEAPNPMASKAPGARSLGHSLLSGDSRDSAGGG